MKRAIPRLVLLLITLAAFGDRAPQQPFVDYLAKYDISARVVDGVIVVTSAAPEFGHSEMIYEGNFLMRIVDGYMRKYYVDDLGDIKFVMGKFSTTFTVDWIKAMRMKQVTRQIDTVTSYLKAQEVKAFHPPK